MSLDHDPDFTNPKMNGQGMSDEDVDCHNCGGTGQDFENVHRDRVICHVCNGSGQAE